MSTARSKTAAKKTSDKTAGAKNSGQNPLLAAWRGPFEIPPFGKIKPEHFSPAFDTAIKEHTAEVDGIARAKSPPTFANTIAALEKSGRSLTRVARVFYNLTGADTNSELQKIEREMSPKLAQHWSSISLNQDLFRRIDDLYKRRAELDLDPEQLRVLERHHLGLVRSGARLDAKGRKRIAAINKRLAILGTQFGQNILADEQAFQLVLDGERDLAGLPDFARAAAARAANDLGHPGKHVVTLSRSSVEPFLQFSARRDLREKAFEAWIRRGENGDKNDNRKIAEEIIALRAERAALLGYRTFAEFRLSDTMAKTPGNVRELLDQVWTAALAAATRERGRLQQVADAEGRNFKLAAWDWRYYAEKVRAADYDLDESAIKPYLQLDRIIAAAFETAKRLFGLTFKERADLPRYHADVRAWEVSGKDGRHVGIFLGDYFARPSKRSGAWMSVFRGQQKLRGEIRPIVVNVMNFSRGADGEPALLSMDDARTLFHEFGHALHGLLSDVTYPSIAGTSVSTDFVELPSQLYEHWLQTPEILKRFAVHFRTGKRMPDELVQRLDASRKFNQGFATVEYVSSALADLELHSLASSSPVDMARFETGLLEKIGMPAEISMRHRLPHFAHIFSGGGYASGYYSYMWSEVMDADAFGAFEETGNVFDRKTAQRLKEFIYSAGNRRDPVEAYTEFRGRLPTSQAMLKKRGLAA
ncbi:MAG: M3 family metallopeptidase [Rhodospirillales bacterium]|nr:M3 family metallopeptidase [Rhodospirillales bacterium]